MTGPRMCALAVMSKAPHVGEVKTRLCPPLSLQQAAALARCFLLDTLERVRSVATVHPVVAYAPADSRAFFQAVAPGFTLIRQHGADLGARMANCCRELLAGGYAGVLLTGSDVPTLPLAYLQQAVEHLMAPEVDMVLGPSEDGGYYLIGLRRLYRTIFEDMPWSTPQVFAETVRRAEAEGLTVACLPSWFDVDTPADLTHLRQALMLDTHETHSRHTREFFRAYS